MALVRHANLRDRDELEAMHQAYLEVLSGLHLEVEAHVLDDAWFTDQERLIPYVGADGDGLAGYMLVLGPAHAQAMGFEVDSYVHELFVRADLRGGGLAQAVLERALRERPGTWAVEVLEANGPASGFWARALADQPELRNEVRGKFRVYWFQS